MQIPIGDVDHCDIDDQGRTCWRTQRKYKIVTKKRGKIVSLSVKLAASVAWSPTLSVCFWKKVCFLVDLSSLSGSLLDIAVKLREMEVRSFEHCGFSLN